MLNSEIVNILMFDYHSLSDNEIQTYSQSLNKKLLRWLGTNHPDNRIRKVFLRLTGIAIGKDTIVNPYCVFSDGYIPLIEIGERCAISPSVNFIAQSGPNNSLLQGIEYVRNNLIKDEKIIVGNDVWIGANVTILPGISIGDRSIIGANSVVTKDIPDDVIAAGCPARIMRWL